MLHSPRTLCFVIIALFTPGSGACVALSQTTASEVVRLRRGFENPPDDCRIMMRWWWFGAAVEKAEIERELKVMKAAGIGGVEIQPVYPVELDNPTTHFRNLPYLSDQYLEALGFAARTAQQLGMRIDVTLGSGWPFGGPHTPVTRAAARLRLVKTTAPDNATSVPVPAIETGEQLVGAFLLEERNDKLWRQISDIRNGRLQLPSADRSVLFFISSRTGQQVKRPAVGAEGFVLDHYDRAAIQQHLAIVGERLLTAFGDHPPYAVFSDSLEVFGTDWTSDFPAQFQRRRGYDLIPHLPALVMNVGPETSAIRHDWGQTLTELVEENYLAPIRQWAHAHHTRFRSQTYGEPPAILSSNDLVDLPEGEHGPEWRGFSATRWASSASHLYKRPVTSSETWTWLHSPAFRATPLDIKAEADLHFLEGINQLVGHGWPYSPASAGEPGWRFYAAAALNEHNPWFHVMPDVAKYLQRMSFLMRQGKPANDIAIYLPTDDAWAQFAVDANNRPGDPAVDTRMDTLLGPNLIPSLLNAGYNFDFIDDHAIDHSEMPYKVLILPGVERIPLETLHRLQRFVASGGSLIATRHLPSLAPGFFDREPQSNKIKELVDSIFKSSPSGAVLVDDEGNLASELVKRLDPDFAIAGASASVIGFVHRKLATADVYFVANTSNQPIDTTAQVHVSWPHGEEWDAVSDAITTLRWKPEGQGGSVDLKLAPYQSKVWIFSDKGDHAKPPPDLVETAAIDLRQEWKLTFVNSKATAEMHQLHSWSDDEHSRYYSGTVVYEKSLSVPDGFLQSGTHVVIDFGPGIPTEPDVKRGPGMRARLDSPVRDCAVVSVNGVRAGAVWQAPFELDISRLIHVGDNIFRITVGNTAMNEMAGHTLPDYKLLNARYGERFVSQDMSLVAPLPSGVIGPLRLIAKRSAQANNH